MKYQKRLLFIISAMAITLLAGCPRGPNYNRPEGPDVALYTTTPLQERTAAVQITHGEAQRFIEGDFVNPQWWHEFGSPKLDALISDAHRANPTLAAAEATLRQAQEVYAARAGSTLYPQLKGSLGSQTQRFSPSSSGLSGDAREFNLYNAGLGAAYTFDLAGAISRDLESLAANINYQRFKTEGARLTLTANIVSIAITRANLAAQVQATEAILDSQEKQLALTRERVRLGQAIPDDVLVLQTQVEQTRASIPLLHNLLQQNEHLLAVLVGQAPGNGSLPFITLQEFTLPVDLPLIVPSELVRYRPDILAAEAVLHSANAQYGVAIAKLYPQLNISATLGTQALTTGALFGAGSTVWSLVGQLTQPLFNPGLPAEKRAALAAFEAAAANYRYVVLEALRSVADVMRALDNDAQRLTSLAAANAAAQGSLESMRRRYALGAASSLQLLVAEQQFQQTRISLIEAQTRRLLDSTVFYQAMGGGSISPGNDLSMVISVP